MKTINLSPPQATHRGGFFIPASDGIGSRTAPKRPTYMNGHLVIPNQSKDST